MSTRRLSLLALTLSATLAVTIPFISRAANTGSTSRQNVSAQSKDETKTDDETQVLTFEVTPNGFEPGETTVRHGKFLILLQNRTGRRDLNFWLARENEGRVAESEPQKRDWKANVRLNPGTYILGETSTPVWKSVIRVTN
ncbi:MAG TPA: hypothetical protein VGD61_01565 [Pyrinomonadaceae bacterium]